METNLNSATVESLTPIWERVFQRAPIGVNDNFFDLGGDSILAVNLFFEIEKVFRREMPPVMIYHAPTIAALAAELEQPTTSRFPTLVLLKPGAEAPPVFIAHGLGGSAIDFFQLVRHIDSTHPIYGMQARGIDGVDEPFDRIEDLAQFYLAAVRQIQPKGPYLLIGYSLGGLVALEMAQQLSKVGEQVALLAMLESYPYPRFLSLGQRIRLAIRVAKYRASSLRRMSIRDAVSYIMLPSKRRFYVSRNVASVTPMMQRARDSAYLSLSRYRPRSYAGKIKFVKAEIRTDFPDDPAAVWRNRVDKVEVDTVPGDHLGIVGKHFESLGSLLSRYLREARGEEETS
jgi:acetoacetyl-CoA synthetase